mmetsp:Transcript_11281/g.29051  ORF Transcript_11281/g.29051 Transcript_11281/m.29051 type:complete len:265 (-) Transcript_11281:128-922(-)
MASERQDRAQELRDGLQERPPPGVAERFLENCAEGENWNLRPDGGRQVEHFQRHPAAQRRPTGPDFGRRRGNSLCRLSPLPVEDLRGEPRIDCLCFFGEVQPRPGGRSLGHGPVGSPPESPAGGDGEADGRPGGQDCRGRGQPERGRAAAPQHRAVHLVREQDHLAGRGHEQRGRGDRPHDPANDQKRLLGLHCADHRPPAQHDRRLLEDHGLGQGPRGRIRATERPPAQAKQHLQVPRRRRQGKVKPVHQKMFNMIYFSSILA